MKATSKRFRAIATLALAATFALTSLIFVAGPVRAAGDLQKVIIRISADLPPPPHPTAIAMHWFKDQVEKEFPKGSEVRLFFAGALYKDPAALTAMTEGNLEIGRAHV